MKTVRDMPDLQGAKVLVRVDLDVPVDEQGKITEEFRIIKQRDNLDYLLSRGARCVLIGHASDPDIGSFGQLREQLQALLGHPMDFGTSLNDVRSFLDGANSLFLLEEIRRWPEEKQNDAVFASELASGFDFYVNNAFSVSHREHASVVSVAGILPAFAGLQVEQEVMQLSKVLDAPAEGKVMVMGGAKASTKVPVIDNLIGTTETVLLGGVVAIDIMKARGIDVKKSRVDDDIERLIESLDVNDPRLVVHGDSVWEGDGIVDIGPKSIEQYRATITTASMVIWNGPMGKFEDERFAAGTKAVADAIVNSDAFSLIGGGDTIAAVNQFGVLDRFDHVSTGGGAMLAFLAGERLPGLAPLGVYHT